MTVSRKRRTLRDELRARCGVFNDQDGRRAPEGWVEIEPVEIDGLGCTPERWSVLNARAILLRRPGEPLTWITIVPRSVAKAAGLDCEDA